MAQTRLPAVLGRDVSGTVELSRADGFAEGDDAFLMCDGCGIRGVRDRLREQNRDEPPGLSHEQHAALPAAGMTAWQTPSTAARSNADRPV